MQISFDTANLTDLDKQVLAVLGGAPVTVQVGGGGGGASAPTTTPAPKKTEKAAKKAEEPEPEPEDADNASDDADEDLVGGDGPSLQDAIELASKLVSKGKAKDVKAALSEVGAKRVSELKGDNIAEFINILS